jgi:hypothetical protein
LTSFTKIFSPQYVLILLLLFISVSFPQEPQIVYISPSFNEIADDEQPVISLEFDIPMDTTSFNNISFAIFGERSAYHSGELEFSNENKTVSFISENIFNAGERVSVSLSKSILSSTGDSLGGFSWTFRIPSQPKPLNFTEPVSYDGGGYGMQCVDMNNDGSPDIVTSIGVIWINNGNGEFSTFWNLDDADLFYPIITDDFNRDGYIDVFYIGSGGLTLGLGNGAGNFIKSYYPWWFLDYISEDFNNDGYPDIAGYNILSNNPPHGDTTSYWAVAFNDGSGQFNDTVWTGQLTGWFRGISSADVDNDGDLDILIISHPAVTPSGAYGLDGLAVFKNNGQYNFDEIQTYPADDIFSIGFPIYLYPSDFNNDNYTDIAIQGNFIGLVSLNLGDGNFGTEETDVRYFWGAEVGAPITGSDFNGDSWIDLAISGYEFPPKMPVPYYGVSTNCFSYFYNCPTHTFFVDTLSTGFIQSVQGADLNKNGYLDLVHSGAGVYITYSTDVTPSVEEELELLDGFFLYHNFPNPFNSQTEISFRINKTGTLQISIYNILGEEVKLLENKEFLPGKYRVEWDGKDNNGMNLPSGGYIIRVNFSGSVKTIKTILLK